MTTTNQTSKIRNKMGLHKRKLLNIIVLCVQISYVTLLNDSPAH